MTLKRILVPTDFSGAAERAFEQALLLARRFSASVLVLHRPVYQVPELPPAGIVEAERLAALDRIMNEYLTDPRREAQKQLQSLVSRAEADGVSASARLETTREPSRAILDAIDAWEPDLVCLGTHGRGGMDKLLMGSVAEKVLRHARANVLVLREGASLAGDGHAIRILVPVDFSDHSQRALGVARELASDFGSGAIHLLHVVGLRHTPFEPGGLTSPFESDPELRGRLEEALRGMLGDTTGDVTVIDGDVAGRILEQREMLQAELVIMGSRGRSGIAHILIGSVAERVARFCETPVWIVK